MLIRPLLSIDRAAILEILSSKNIFTQQELEVAAELIDTTLSCPEKGEYLISCAVDSNDRVAGYICYGEIPMTEGRYDLYWIAVDNRFSRQGVGKMLLDFMEGQLRNKNGKRVYIDTSSTPNYLAARSFYEKNGYNIVCILEDFYRIADHKIIFMKKL
ncbi:MAG: hypothetical protein A2511_02705 [Deltaproteobacteria bacterium RIFOXYD12_FULL_50_9]|nr:MAG: hypothetical protein A2511_02705 [Deltaproteobacteria bacterium RIFOXYD12_FULL_50_9]